MSTRGLWTLLVAAAVWPVWPWYAGRIIETPDDRMSVLALAMLIGAWLFAARHRRIEPLSVPQITLAASLLLLYAVGWSVWPALIRAALALTAMVVVAGGPRPGWLGLAWLALPAMPSLQFFLGFPMRRWTTEGAAMWLRLSGLDVASDGTHLVWRGLMVAVDAPCSGLRMAWASAFLVAALATLHDFGWRQSLRLAGLATLMLPVANVLRAGALFGLEAGLLPAGAEYHEAVGWLVFGGCVGVIAWAAKRDIGPQGMPDGRLA